LSLELLKVGELLGGDLNEVWREAHNPRELRAVHCAEQSPGSPKKIAALLGELKLPEYPQVPANIPATHPQPGEDHRGVGCEVKDRGGRLPADLDQRDAYGAGVHSPSV
jgi:hypothetical protein